MRVATSTVGMLLLVACASGVAAQPEGQSAAPAGRCMARSGEVIFSPAGSTAKVDALQYNGAEGTPLRDGKTLPLCRDVPYRIVPLIKPNCIIAIPASGTSPASVAGQIRARARAQGCPVPRLSVVTSAPGAAGRVLKVVPSGQVDLHYRREIVAVVEGVEPPVIADARPCRIGGVPEAAGTVGDLHRAYLAQSLPPGCPKLAAVVLVNNRFATSNSVPAETPIGRTWPARGDDLDTRHVRPVWIALPPAQVPPATIRVPRVVEMSVAEAVSEIEALNLPAPLLSVDGGLADASEAGERIVSAQSRAPGTDVATDEQLTLVAAPVYPAVETPIAPPALLVTGLMTGALGTEVVRRAGRRRKTSGPGSTPPAAKPIEQPQAWMVRVRPDLRGMPAGDGAPT